MTDTICAKIIELNRLAYQNNHVYACWQLENIYVMAKKMDARLEAYKEVVNLPHTNLDSKEIDWRRDVKEDAVRWKEAL